MNIKITKEQADFIFNRSKSSYIIGSRLYSTAKENSDTDHVIIYKSFHEDSDLIYPNYHQFQWDDSENNSQYVFTSERQFWKNLLSGDSSINADIILFYNEYNDDEKLNICRTYNIIKSFIGFAKRDIKNYKAGKGKNKLFHIERGLYCAHALMENALPNIYDFKFCRKKDIDSLEKYEKTLRETCNYLFEKNDLTMYPKNSLTLYPKHSNLYAIDNELEQLLINYNNIREFKY